ncbi:hypothetical protein FB475_5415 [Kribbella jejuensis]|uniref:Uncharacterized protein n=1 Tax=Kribbella jejuensis TaxID=236068 RepID=A0A542EAY8_9ACTN|nr:hypothetical protein FB475_5415 [Kribbella jejuensis]
MPPYRSADPTRTYYVYNAGLDPVSGKNPAPDAA